MIRPKRTVTSCCPMCKREGWTREKRYALSTLEEISIPELRADLIQELSFLSGCEPVLAGAGCTINEACEEAVELAKQIGKPVVFMFNEAPVVARADSNAIELVERWYLRRYGKTSAQIFAER